MSFWPDWWAGDWDFLAAYIEANNKYDVLTCSVCERDLLVGEQFYGYRDTDGLYIAHRECVTTLKPCPQCKGDGYMRIGDTRNVAQCATCQGRRVVPK